MADDERDLTLLVTRGFAGMAEQLRERDKELAGLSEKIIRMEGALDTVKTTLVRVEADISKAEIERVKMRVDNLESANTKADAKQLEVNRRIWGLIAGMIVLILGWLFNFIRIGLK